MSEYALYTLKSCFKRNYLVCWLCMSTSVYYASLLCSCCRWPPCIWRGRCRDGQAHSHNFSEQQCFKMWRKVVLIQVKSCMLWEKWKCKRLWWGDPGLGRWKKWKKTSRKVKVENHHDITLAWQNCIWSFLIKTNFNKCGLHIKNELHCLVNIRY